MHQNNGRMTAFHFGHLMRLGTLHQAVKQTRALHPVRSLNQGEWSCRTCLEIALLSLLENERVILGCECTKRLEQF